MSKIEINKAAEILKKNQLEPALLRRVVEEMNLAVQPEPGEDAPPAVKKQFVILISDPEHQLPADCDFAGWVLQIGEGESPASTMQRICRAAYDFNASKRGRMMPAVTVGDALENIPGRYFKEAAVWVKTKTPVLMLRTDNRIPTGEKLPGMEGQQ